MIKFADTRRSRAVLAGCVGLTITAVATVACGGNSSTPSEAFCSDLEAGLTATQILMPTVRDGTHTASEAADLAYGFAAIDCPDQLVSNEPLRTYLSGWNINPDA